MGKTRYRYHVDPVQLVIWLAVTVALFAGMVYTQVRGQSGASLGDKLADAAIQRQTVAQAKPAEGDLDPMHDLVDFASLRAVNPAVTGWVQVIGSETIDQPVVRESDWQSWYYNDHDWQGRYTIAGALLTPPLETGDVRTMVLGHHMNRWHGEWQFSSLSDWYASSDDVDRPAYYWRQRGGDYSGQSVERYELLSASLASVDEAPYDHAVVTNDERARLADYLASRGANWDTRSPLLMLSTCDHWWNDPGNRYLVLLRRVELFEPGHALRASQDSLDEISAWMAKRQQ